MAKGRKKKKVDASRDSRRSSEDDDRVDDSDGCDLDKGQVGLREKKKKTSQQRRIPSAGELSLKLRKARFISSKTKTAGATDKLLNGGRYCDSKDGVKHINSDLKELKDIKFLPDNKVDSSASSTPVYQSPAVQIKKEPSHLPLQLLVPPTLRSETKGRKEPLMLLNFSKNIVVTHSTLPETLQNDPIFKAKTVLKTSFNDFTDLYYKLCRKCRSSLEGQRVGDLNRCPCRDLAKQTRVVLERISKIKKRKKMTTIYPVENGVEVRKPLKEEETYDLNKNKVNGNIEEKMLPVVSKLKLDNVKTESSEVYFLNRGTMQQVSKEDNLSAESKLDIQNPKVNRFKDDPRKIPPLIIPKRRIKLMPEDDDDDKTPEYPLREDSLFNRPLFKQNPPQNLSEDVKTNEPNRNVFSVLTSMQQHEVGNQNQYKLNGLDAQNSVTPLPEKIPQRPEQLPSSPDHARRLSNILKLQRSLSKPQHKVQRVQLIPKEISGDLKIEENVSNSGTREKKDIKAEKTKLLRRTKPDSERYVKKTFDFETEESDKNYEQIPRLSPVKDECKDIMMPISQYPSQPPCLERIYDDSIAYCDRAETPHHLYAGSEHGATIVKNEPEVIIEIVTENSEDFSETEINPKALPSDKNQDIPESDMKNREHLRGDRGNEHGEHRTFGELGSIQRNTNSFVSQDVNAMNPSVCQNQQSTDTSNAAKEVGENETGLLSGGKVDVRPDDLTLPDPSNLNGQTTAYSETVEILFQETVDNQNESLGNDGVLTNVSDKCVVASDIPKEVEQSNQSAVESMPLIVAQSKSPNQTLVKNEAETAVENVHQVVVESELAMETESEIKIISCVSLDENEGIHTDNDAERLVDTNVSMESLSEPHDQTPTVAHDLKDPYSTGVIISLDTADEMRLTSSSFDVRSDNNAKDLDHEVQTVNCKALETQTSQQFTSISSISLKDQSIIETPSEGKVEQLKAFVSEPKVDISQNSLSQEQTLTSTVHHSQKHIPTPSPDKCQVMNESQSGFNNKIDDTDPEKVDMNPEPRDSDPVLCISTSLQASAPCPSTQADREIPRGSCLTEDTVIQNESETVLHPEIQETCVTKLSYDEDLDSPQGHGLNEEQTKGNPNACVVKQQDNEHRPEPSVEDVTCKLNAENGENKQPTKVTRESNRTSDSMSKLSLSRHGTSNETIQPSMPREWNENSNLENHSPVHILKEQEMTQSKSDFPEAPDLSGSQSVDSSGNDDYQVPLPKQKRIKVPKAHKHKISSETLNSEIPPQKVKRGGKQKRSKKQSKPICDSALVQEKTDLGTSKDQSVVVSKCSDNDKTRNYEVIPTSKNSLNIVLRNRKKPDSDKVTTSRKGNGTKAPIKRRGSRGKSRGSDADYCKTIEDVASNWTGDTLNTDLESSSGISQPTSTLEDTTASPKMVESILKSDSKKMRNYLNESPHIGDSQPVENFGCGGVQQTSLSADLINNTSPNTYSNRGSGPLADSDRPASVATQGDYAEMRETDGNHILPAAFAVKSGTTFRKRASTEHTLPVGLIKGKQKKNDVTVLVLPTIKSHDIDDTASCPNYSLSSSYCKSASPPKSNAENKIEGSQQQIILEQQKPKGYSPVTMNTRTEEPIRPGLADNAKTHSFVMPQAPVLKSNVGSSSCREPVNIRKSPEASCVTRTSQISDTSHLPQISQAYYSQINSSQLLNSAAHRHPFLGTERRVFLPTETHSQVNSNHSQEFSSSSPSSIIPNNGADCNATRNEVERDMVSNNCNREGQMTSKSAPKKTYTRDAFLHNVPSQRETATQPRESQAVSHVHGQNPVASGQSTIDLNKSSSNDPFQSAAKNNGASIELISQGLPMSIPGFLYPVSTINGGFPGQMILRYPQAVNGDLGAKGTGSHRTGQRNTNTYQMYNRSLSLDVQKSQEMNLYRHLYHAQKGSSAARDTNNPVSREPKGSVPKDSNEEPIKYPLWVKVPNESSNEEPSARKNVHEQRNSPSKSKEDSQLYQTASATTSRAQSFVANSRQHEGSSISDGGIPPHQTPASLPNPITLQNNSFTSPGNTNERSRTLPESAVVPGKIQQPASPRFSNAFSDTVHYQGTSKEIPRQQVMRVLQHDMSIRFPNALPVSHFASSQAESLSTGNSCQPRILINVSENLQPPNQVILRDNAILPSKSLSPQTSVTASTVSASTSQTSAAQIAYLNGKNACLESLTGGMGQNCLTINTDVEALSSDQGDMPQPLDLSKRSEKKRGISSECQPEKHAQNIRHGKTELLCPVTVHSSEPPVEIWEKPPAKEGQLTQLGVRVAPLKESETKHLGDSISLALKDKESFTGAHVPPVSSNHHVGLTKTIVVNTVTQSIPMATSSAVHERQGTVPAVVQSCTQAATGKDASVRVLGEWNPKTTSMDLHSTTDVHGNMLTSAVVVSPTTMHADPAPAPTVAKDSYVKEHALISNSRNPKVMAREPLISLKSQDHVIPRRTSTMSDLSSPSERSRLSSPESVNSSDIIRAPKVIGLPVKDFFTSPPKEDTYSSLLLAKITAKNKRPEDGKGVSDDIFGIVPQKERGQGEEFSFEISNNLQKSSVIDLTEGNVEDDCDVVSISSKDSCDDTRNCFLDVSTRDKIPTPGSVTLNSTALDSTEDIPTGERVSQLPSYLLSCISDISSADETCRDEDGSVKSRVENLASLRNMFVNSSAPAVSIEDRPPISREVIDISKHASCHETSLDTNQVEPTGLTIGPAAKEKVAEKLRAVVASRSLSEEDATSEPEASGVSKISKNRYPDESQPLDLRNAITSRDVEAVEKQDEMNEVKRQATTFLKISEMYNRVPVIPENSNSFQEKVYQVHPTLDNNEKEQHGRNSDISSHSKSHNRGGTRTGRRVGRPPKDQSIVYERTPTPTTEIDTISKEKDSVVLLPAVSNVQYSEMFSPVASTPAPLFPEGMYPPNSMYTNIPIHPQKAMPPNFIPNLPFGRHVFLPRLIQGLCVPMGMQMPPFSGPPPGHRPHLNPKVTQLLRFRSQAPKINDFRFENASKETVAVNQEPSGRGRKSRGKPRGRGRGRVGPVPQENAQTTPCEVVSSETAFAHISNNMQPISSDSLSVETGGIQYFDGNIPSAHDVDNRTDIPLLIDIPSDHTKVSSVSMPVSGVTNPYVTTSSDVQPRPSNSVVGVTSASTSHSPSNKRKRSSSKNEVVHRKVHVTSLENDIPTAEEPQPNHPQKISECVPTTANNQQQLNYSSKPQVLHSAPFISQENNKSLEISISTEAQQTTMDEDYCSPTDRLVVDMDSVFDGHNDPLLEHQSKGSVDPSGRTRGNSIDEIMYSLNSDNKTTGSVVEGDGIVAQTHNEDGLVVLSLHSPKDCLEESDKKDNTPCADDLKKKQGKDLPSCNTVNVQNCHSRSWVSTSERRQHQVVNQELDSNFRQVEHGKEFTEESVTSVGRRNTGDNPSWTTETSDKAFQAAQSLLEMQGINRSPDNNNPNPIKVNGLPSLNRTTVDLEKEKEVTSWLATRMQQSH